jgi:hypothetical protein
MPRSLAFVFLAVVSSLPAQAEDRVTLDGLSVHLFLTKSGTLSPDMTAIEDFTARNFVPNGTGFDVDQERFYDILIRLKFTSPREAFAKGRQAELVVTHRNTKKVIKRQRFGDIYVGSYGWTYLPFFMANAACEPLVVTATGGAVRISKTLELSCGE